MVHLGPFLRGARALGWVGLSLVAGCDEAGSSDGGGGSGGGADFGGGQAEGGAIAAGGADSGGETAISPRPIERCGGFATEVIEVSYGPGAGFGQAAMPEIVLGPPFGAGEVSGSLDVLTLGNGGSIILGFGAQTIVDRPGADFIVFENPFYQGGNEELPFAELATVSVSQDGVTFFEFPCTATHAPYGACAGVSPVLASYDNDIDPRDPSESGGDAFDLADVGLQEARFIRIVDRVDLTGFRGTFDLDAVALVSASCTAP